MKITDLQVIPFKVPSREFKNGEFYNIDVIQTLTKVITDEGAEGYCFGGQHHGDMYGLTADNKAIMENQIKPMLLGQNPFDREKFWHWMWPLLIPEYVISVVDMALWDLQGRICGVPVHKPVRRRDLRKT